MPLRSSVDHQSKEINGKENLIPNQYIDSEESDEVAEAVSIANTICRDDELRASACMPYWGPVCQLPVILNGTLYSFLAVDVHYQTDVDWLGIKTKMNVDFFGGVAMNYVQAIGDMGGWTDDGYTYFQDKIEQELDEESTALLFGTSADVGEGFNGVNNAVIEILSRRPDLRKRVIGNVVNQTIESIYAWGCQAPRGLAAYWLVYCPKYAIDCINGTYFGQDTNSSDFMADKTIAGGGDAEVLEQGAHMLQQGKPYETILGMKIPRLIDGKPELDASQFFCDLKKEASNTEVTNTEVSSWASDWISGTSWYDPDANDKATKEPAMLEAERVLFNPEIQAWRAAPQSVQCLTVPDQSGISPSNPVMGVVAGVAAGIAAFAGLTFFCKRRCSRVKPAITDEKLQDSYYTLE